MARNLYVHIGPAKTGTSAVQAVLSRSEQHEILYPKVGLWADGSHHNLVFSFFGKSPRRETRQESVNSLFAQIALEADRSHSDVLISSEALAGYRRLPDFVRALREHLGAAFRAEILFVARNHVERAASVYNQRVKDEASRERRDPDMFLVEQAERMCYGPMLRPLLQAGLSVRVLNYHPAKTFLARFLVNIGAAESDEVPELNVSLSTKALVATLEANRLAISRADRDKIVTALRSMPKCFSPSSVIFGSDAVRLAERFFDADRTFLKEEFGVALPEHVRDAGRLAVSAEEFGDIVKSVASAPEAGVLCERVRRYIQL